MAPRNKPTLSKAHREAIRKAALLRHAERKALGLPSPFGVAYVTSPAILPSVVPEAVPEMVPNVAMEPLKVESFVATATVQTVSPQSPRDRFKAWLRSRQGVQACDTRMSQDPVRLGAELEDRLFVAWQAGFEERGEG
jgi:hypothetical protein